MRPSGFADRFTVGFAGLREDAAVLTAEKIADGMWMYTASLRFNGTLLRAIRLSTYAPKDVFAQFIHTPRGLTLRIRTVRVIIAESMCCA